MRASFVLLLAGLTLSVQPGWAQSTILNDQSLYTGQTQAVPASPDVRYNQMPPPIYSPPPIVNPQIDNAQQYFQSTIDDSCCFQPCVDQTCCQSQCGLYAGFAAVFAKPHFKESFEYSQTNTATGMQTLVPFQYDYEFTPRAFVGFKSDSGAGIRGSYWQFKADSAPTDNVADGINIYGAHAVTIIFPANIFAAFPGQTLNTSSSLDTQIFDLFATLDGSVGSVSATGGFGLRYGKLVQSISSMVSVPPGPPTGILQWEREFEGFGPAAFLEAKKRLGTSRLSAVATGGGALLFGKKQLDRTVIGDQSPQPATPFLSLQEADEVVGIGEIGMGTEWAGQFQHGHSLRVRGTYEGQLWAESGAPTLGFLGFEGFGIQIELAR